MTVTAIMCTAGTSHARWSLIEANADGVAARWSSPTVRIDTVITGGQITLQPALEDASAEGEPGTPAVPRAGTMIAVPVGMQAVITANAGEWETVQGLLSPVPAHVLREDRLGYRRVFSMAAEAYTTTIPDLPLATTEPVGEANGVNLLRVIVAPVRVQTSEAAFSFTRTVSVRVRFVSNGAPVSSSTGGITPLPATWDGTVINAAEMRRLQRPSRLQRAAQSSPFASGAWLRIVVDSDAMYKVTASKLAAADDRFRNAPVAKLALYAGSGRELPVDPVQTRQTALDIVRPVVVDGNGDGLFNETDYLLFHGRGPSGWDSDYQTLDPVYSLNRYTYENVYWLTIATNDAPRAEQRNGAVTDPAAPVIERFFYRYHEEPEMTNLNEEADTDGPTSGLDWYWEQLQPQATRTLQLSMVDVAGDTFSFRLGHLRMFSAFGSVGVKVNGVSQPSNEQRQTSTYGWFYGYSGRVTQGSQASATVEIQNASTGYPTVLDYYEVGYWRRFAVRGTSFLFALPPLRSTVPAASVVVPLTSIDRTQHRLFEVTVDSGLVEYSLPVADEFGVTRVQLRQSGLLERKYLIVAESDWKQPIRLETKNSPSNLRGRTAGADYIVITHPDFQAQAERLAAFRAQHDRFRTAVVSTRDIYDEFSFGMFDPAALRDFLRFAFINWRDGATDAGVRYVVLVGDGQYDYRNLSGFTTNKTNPQPGNWLPTYQEGALTTDDWFAVFDRTGIASVQIGRLCVQTREEARTAIDKIIAYEENPEHGAWQNRVVMIADDEFDLDRGINSENFVDDSERLTNCLRPETVAEKLYSIEKQMDEQMHKSAMNKLITDAWSRGAVLINYIGHGNPVLWAHERIFTLDGDLAAIQNGKRLPVLTALTCSAGHFDAPSTQSMAEVLVNMANGGVVASVAASRLSYNTENVDFNDLFLNRLFRSTSSRTPRLGDAFWSAKTAALQNPSWLFRENTRKFVLIGDPAQTIALPELSVHVDAGSDSLRALGRSDIRGAVLTPGATDTLRSFSGSALVSLFDSATPATYRTAAGTTIIYWRSGSPMFRGMVPVVNGVFSAQAILPLEVIYGGDQARAVAQVWNEQIGGAGAVGGLRIGTRPASTQIDTTGPAILFSRAGDPDERTPLTDGAEIPEGEAVRVWVSDPSGVNVGGGIGHRLLAYINNERRDPVDLTEQFVHWEGATAGWADVPLASRAGLQQVVVEAWDNGNNYAADSVFLRIGRPQDIRLANVIAVPNPMETAVTFTCVLDGIGGASVADATVKVFTVAGRLVETISKLDVTDGPLLVPWIPAHPLANGVYLYQISIRRRSDGRTVRSVERLAVVGL